MAIYIESFIARTLIVQQTATACIKIYCNTFCPSRSALGKSRCLEIVHSNFHWTLLSLVLKWKALHFFGFRRKKASILHKQHRQREIHHLMDGKALQSVLTNTPTCNHKSTHTACGTFSELIFKTATTSRQTGTAGASQCITAPTVARGQRSSRLVNKPVLRLLADAVFFYRHKGNTVGSNVKLFSCQERGEVSQNNVLNNIFHFHRIAAALVWKVKCRKVPAGSKYRWIKHKSVANEIYFPFSFATLSHFPPTHWMALENRC